MRGDRVNLWEKWEGLSNSNPREGKPWQVEVGGACQHIKSGCAPPHTQHSPPLIPRLNTNGLPLYHTQRIIMCRRVRLTQVN